MQLNTSHRLGIFWLLGLMAVCATAAEPVRNTLAVYRIASPAGGAGAATAASSDAASANPGDVLEYVAEFHNDGVSTARGLRATLPLPPGTELVAGSPRPAAALASVDGVHFDAMPLKRVVKQADGGTREELVPLREYRFLRWPAADLAAGGALTVSARVAISTGPAG